MARIATKAGKTPAKKKPGPAKGSGLTFTGRLWAPMEGKGWTFLDLPADSAQALGSKARVAVKGTINGAPFRTSVAPSGKGHHVLMVNQEMRTAARAEAGDEVRVEVSVDATPRTVTVPRDLAKAIAGSKEAQAQWARFPYSHRKLYVEWIEEAKRPETRQARIEKAVERVAAGKPQR